MPRHRFVFIAPLTTSTLPFLQVTATQMASVLDNAGISVTEAEREILFQSFQVFDGKLATNRINYLSLVRLVDDVEM